MRLLMPICIAFLVALLGCQSPTNTTTSKTMTLDWTGWYVQNLPADWWSDGSTSPSMVYEFSAGMSKNTLASDVSSMDIYLPGSKTEFWSFPSTYFDEASHSWGIKSTHANWYDDKAALPLGTMNVVVNLSDGRKLSSTIVATQPGSTTAGPTVVANDQSTVTTYGNKVAALPRPIVTSAVKNPTNTQLTVQFTETDPQAAAYNGWVWLYDGTGAYLGGFYYFRDRATPHTVASQLNSGSAIKTDGTANVLVLNLADLETDSGAAFTSSLLASVGKVRVVVCDGGQYPSMTGTYYDYRSISAKASVN